MSSGWTSNDLWIKIQGNDHWLTYWPFICPIARLFHCGSLPLPRRTWTREVIKQDWAVLAGHGGVLEGNHQQWTLHFEEAPLWEDVGGRIYDQAWVWRWRLIARALFALLGGAIFIHPKPDSMIQNMKSRHNRAHTGCGQKLGSSKIHRNSLLFSWGLLIHWPAQWRESRKLFMKLGRIVTT